MEAEGMAQGVQGNAGPEADSLREAEPPFPAGEGGSSCHPALLRRLSRIEGQVRGIKHMIESGSPCLEVLDQIAAARSALDASARVLVEGYLDERLSLAPSASGDPLGELKESLARYIRL